MPILPPLVRVQRQPGVSALRRAVLRAVKPAQPEVEAEQPIAKEEFAFCHVCRMKNSNKQALRRCCETNLFTEYDLSSMYYQTSNRVGLVRTT